MLKAPLLLGFQHIFDSRCMPALLSAGIIALIPKGGDSCDLRQWHPITLLSIAYKLLAHMINARLNPFLPDLIHDAQARFIQEHCILNNIVTFYEAIEWASHSSRSLAIF